MEKKKKKKEVEDKTNLVIMTIQYFLLCITSASLLPVLVL